MKEILDIRLFDKGTISKPDAQDISSDACIYSNNIDPNAEGELKSIKDNVEYNAAITSDINLGAWIERDDNKKDLIFSNSANIGAVTDFYGTLGLSASLASSSGLTMVADAKSVHIGTTDTPKWAGYIKSPRFNGVVTADVNGFDGFMVKPGTLPDEPAVYEIQIDTEASPVYVTPTTATYDFATKTATFTKAGHGLSTSDEVRVKMYWIKLYFPSTPPYLPMGWEDIDLAGKVTEALTVTVSDIDTFSVPIDFQDYTGYTEGTGFWQFNNADFSGDPADTVYTKTLSDLTYNYRKIVGGTPGAYTSYQPITFDVYDEIVDGIEIKFIENTGYHSGDAWTITISAKTDTLTLTEAEPAVVDCLGISVIQGDTGTNFEDSKTYFYGYSLIYDYIQESELIVEKVSYTPSVDSDDLVVGLKIDDSILPARVTGINLYRAEASTVNVNYPDTLYALVESINFEGWRDKNYTVFDSAIGATYEANSGLPQNIKEITPSYKVSCQLNSSLFIGDCAHSKIGDASHTIFKSKSFRYDTFDWINEGLKIPFVPKAMAGYEGKLWIFDSARILRVNSDLYIEDIIEGIGITTSNAYVVCDYGMFWADVNGCYRIVNGEVYTISRNIEDVFRHDNRYVLDVKYDAPSNCVLFFCTENPLAIETDESFELEESTDILYANDSVLSYHVIKNRWDERQGFSTGDFVGAITGINGETYISESEGFMECFVGSHKPIEWISQEFVFNSASQYKIFYELFLDDTNSTLLYEYSIDNGVSWTVFTGETNIGGSWLKAKKFKFKISGTTDGVKAITIKYRELVNK